MRRGTSHFDFSSGSGLLSTPDTPLQPQSQSPNDRLGSISTTPTPTANHQVPHLAKEFQGFFTSDDNGNGTIPSSSTDFYDVHSLLCLSPKKRSVFFIKRDANNGDTSPAEVVLKSPDGIKFTAFEKELMESDPPSESSTRPTRPYNLRFPQSLYGPLGESMPKLTSQNLNQLVSSGGHTGSVEPSPNFAARKSLNSTNSLLGGDSDGRGAMEDRTLSQLAEASKTTATTRDFATEWIQALTMHSTASLSSMSCRFAVLKSIAEDFSQSVAPIACAIIESRNQQINHRPYRPLPTLDHVYLVKGCVFVLAETPARLQLYGSHVAASKAASNEIRAIRTILGNPLLSVYTPLCCCIGFMGYHVYVSVPLRLPKNPEAALACGSFRPPRIAISNGSIYTTHKMGEYIPLARHTVPESQLPEGSHQLPEAKRTLVTPCDMKLMYVTSTCSLYAMDAARYLPPAVCHTKDYSKAKTKDDGMGSKGLSRHPVEDEPLAYLSVLFRPEFMRHSCPLQLNPDANTPHQPLSSQENISHAIHTIFTQNCWQLTLDLVSLEQSKSLQVADIASHFHRHGVNLRYLGKVYADVELAVKSLELRENIKAKLAIEASCRAFKALVNTRLSQETRHRGEDSTIITLFRQFLVCIDHHINFWESQIKPLMSKMFGFYVKVARETTSGTQDSDGVFAQSDGSNLNVYKCISSVKRRVQRFVPTLNWKEVGGGYVALDEEGMERLRRQNEDALSVLYPLLGAHARENSDLLIRAQQLIHVDITSDLRGKKILVNFRPQLKSCTPLILSPTIQTVVALGPTNVLDVLGQSNDPVPLSEAVEAAAKAEIAAIAKISESDPRATLPLQMLSLSMSARYLHPQAYAALSRCFDLRKNVPIDIVVGGTSLELAHMYSKAHSIERAETFSVDALHSLRNATTGTDIALFTESLIRVAGMVSSSLVESSGKPQLERAQKTLEYLYYACYLAESYGLSCFVVVALWQIGVVRKRLALSMPCFRCNRQAELTAKGDFDPLGVEKLSSEKDAASIGSKPATLAAATVTTATAQSKGRGQVPVHRRKKEEQRKDDDDMAEVFAKKTIEKIQLLYLDNVGGPSRVVANAAGSAGLASTASSVNLAALAQQALSGQESINDVPLCAALGDAPRPSTICKVVRYTCKSCSSKHPAPEKEPIMKEVASVFAAVSKIGKQLPPTGPHISLDTNIIGDALLNLGTLETHADAVGSAISELSRTFGPDSRVVITASMELADVLLESVKHATGPIAAGLSGTVIVNPPTGGSTANGAPQVTQQFVTVGVSEAEQVLQQALSKILKRPAEFPTELNSVVSKLLSIAQIYSQHPAAKKEHAAAHYLSEVLPPALGESHPLVGAAYNATKYYYVQLSKKRSDRVAASTALITAGKFACLALASRSSCPDTEDELDSLLTVMADDILKVLRAGSPGDRRASEDLFAQCRLVVMDSLYRNSLVVQQRLIAMEDIFKTQLKVMEQSEALSRLIQRLDDARNRMVQLSQSIKRHRNRVDLYGKQCLQGITDIRDDAVKACRGVDEPEVHRKIASLDELHALLTKTDPKSQQDVNTASNVSTEANSWDMLLGLTKSQAPDGRGNESSGSKAPSTDPSDESRASGGGGKSYSGVNAQAQYVSPYAILGGAPASLDDLAAAESSGGTATATRMVATASSGRLRRTHSRHTHHRESQKSLSLTPASQYYLQALSLGRDPIEVSGSHRQHPDEILAKNPETVDRIASLMPKISQSFVSKNYNPIRAHAQNQNFGTSFVKK